MVDLLERFYPEVAIGGFSRVDASVEFYTRIAALLKPGYRVLDYGAGRGAQIETDSSPYRRWLKTLKGRVAHVEGCDVDPVVLQNPYLDAARVMNPGMALPYADESFDLVFSNWVFEHIDDPTLAANELLRVVKPGGYVCALTPNKWGYIAVCARLVGNANHVRLLKYVQPDRRDYDVFPTRYRLNTPRSVHRHFGHKARIVVYAVSSEPAYHFNRPWLFRMFKVMHAFVPERFQTTLVVFIRKLQ